MYSAITVPVAVTTYAFEISSLFIHYFTATVTELTQSHSVLLLCTAPNVFNCSALHCTEVRSKKPTESLCCLLPLYRHITCRKHCRMLIGDPGLPRQLNNYPNIPEGEGLHVSKGLKAHIDLTMRSHHAQ
jgi:hypothetical protein